MTDTLRATADFSVNRTTTGAPQEEGRPGCRSRNHNGITRRDLAGPFLRHEKSAPVRRRRGLVLWTVIAITYSWRLQAAAG